MIYSQRDEKWAKIKLGTSNETIGSAGCLVTILAMLFDKTPREVNEILLARDGYFYGNLLNWIRAGEIFGFEYLGKKVYPPVIYPAVAEVRLDGHQHFILLLNKNDVADPWFGDVVAAGIRYKTIINYRHIRIFEAPQKDLAKDFLSILSIFKKHLSAAC